MKFLSSIGNWLYWHWIELLSSFVFLIIIVVPVAGITTYTVMAYHNENTYKVTVTDKIVKNDGHSGTYLIYTKDQNGNVRVFENADALFAKKFDSSDMQARIKVGKQYEFKTIGFRIPVLSAYENIIQAKEIKQN